jgi:hypothetical protein
MAYFIISFLFTYFGLIIGKIMHHLVILLVNKIHLIDLMCIYFIENCVNLSDLNHLCRR